MESRPSFEEGESFESTGSVCLASPFALSSPYHTVKSAVPVYPVNSDDFVGVQDAIEYHSLSSASASSSSSSASLSSSFPLLLNSSSPLDERHVFLCFKEPQNWPPLVEAAVFDRLPRFLAATIKARKHEMPVKTRLTICEGRDGTESSNGDVMIFPDMVRYRGLTHFDVDAFVDEVLVRKQEWLSGKPEKLVGTNIFVCAHASHDANCGVSGFIVGKLRDELSARGLAGQVFVRPCSHIGPHKHAGNLIVYSSAAGDVSRRCYGYVTSGEVCSLLDELFGKEYSAEDFWRDNEFQGDPQNQCSDGAISLGNGSWLVQRYIRSHKDKKSADPPKVCNVGLYEAAHHNGCREMFSSKKRWWQTTRWLDSWEREDSLAALAVIGAAASVLVACHLYKSNCRH